ncbi:MAG TPA: ParB/RepB/Spo0J family partition protein [Syntrophorhabdaceae bacterium]|nr:ParB/RepB/Spo0J family partition protein [Syntrophorhabdaceae bacterium]
MTGTAKLPITDIFPNPNQPRKDFDQVKLEELAASIREYGVRQPILVTPREGRYMIVAGERRFRASLIKGLTHMPAVIDEMNDDLVEELALLENIQREDLNVIEIALAYKGLMDRGWTAEQLATKMGFRQVWRIDEKIRLLNLTEENRKLVIKGKLTNAQAQELARLKPEHQAIALAKILSGACPTYNKLRALVDSLLLKESQFNLFELEEMSDEERAVIDRTDALLTAIERLIGQTSSPESVKKAAYHEAITASRIDFIINHLMKLRKAAFLGEAIRQAASSDRP